MANQPCKISHARSLFDGQLALVDSEILGDVFSVFVFSANGFAFGQSGKSVVVAQTTAVGEFLTGFALGIVSEAGRKIKDACFINMNNFIMQ